MSLARKLTVSALLAALALGTVLPSLVRAKPPVATTSAPASGPATTRAAKVAKRDVDDVVQDLKATDGQIRKSLGSLANLLDEKKRVEVAPTAIPALKKMLTLFAELKDVTGDDKADSDKFQLLPILAVLGDADSEKMLADLAKDKNVDIAMQATLGTHMTSWWKNASNEAEQKKILATMGKLLADHPESDEIQGTLMAMANLGAATPAIRKQAKAIQGEPEEGQPIAFAGPTIDGKKFSTADVKGKILVVDFWATWCGPCRAELPKLVKIYKKYHEKGVEFVGISLDQTADDLKDFLKANPDLSWTQVFDEKQPLAKKYGIEAIPTMYLIDQEGKLVTTEARGKLEELLPKLLGEKVADTQPGTQPATQPTK